eukprot:1842909-Lingulodinium_polyedra.AAC.1
MTAPCFSDCVTFATIPPSEVSMALVFLFRVDSNAAGMLLLGWPGSAPAPAAPEPPPLCAGVPAAPPASGFSPAFESASGSPC